MSSMIPRPKPACFIAKGIPKNHKLILTLKIPYKKLSIIMKIFISSKLMTTTNFHKHSSSSRMYRVYVWFLFYWINSKSDCDNILMEKEFRLPVTYDLCVFFYSVNFIALLSPTKAKIIFELALSFCLSVHPSIYFFHVCTINTTTGNCAEQSQQGP